MADSARETIVTDIKIPFWSMVVLLVKWALASIPAVIILIVIGTAVSAAVNTIFGGTFPWWGGRMM